MYLQFRHPDSGHGSQRPPARGLCVQDRIAEAAKRIHAYRERADERGVLGRFESINRARLHRIREALRPEQVRFFDVLPLLFHVNRPGLPGYVSRETPAGIKRFAPGPEAMDAALHLFRSAIGAGEAAEPRDLLGIYCLGSLGSIAHCPESDLDVWVCHEPGIEARRLAELNAKARVIEQWAQGLGLEVHFFLIDPERFRAGGHARLSAECSGNAQHYLLLDEFYRSSVVLAGLCPMWWRVPPAEEHRYAECVAGLQAVPPEMPGVDLGGLGEVPREEFAGAALWQLGKVIDAPYKSVLKLLLLEAYAGEYPRPDLLAMRYKAYIYGGAADAEALDPYWLLYRRVEEYLERQADTPRLALARRCLYFKAQEAQRHLPSHVARAWRGTVHRGAPPAMGLVGRGHREARRAGSMGLRSGERGMAGARQLREDELPGPGRVRPAARRALVRHGRGDHGPGTAPARRLRTASR